jgi:photosystem II stability/assembly factor-like uncharacterized protein
VTDPRDARVVYYGSNNLVFRSANRGESFQIVGTTIPNASKIKNIIISKKDPAMMLIAIKGASSDQILKSNNGGITWTVTANGLTFSYFGIPMTPDPAHPDTIYTMSGNNFMKSVNFGDTWTTISTPSNFNAPCDIEVFPDSANIILVGDNTTGIFRSTDYGVTWQQRFQTSGEIPTIAIDKHNPANCFATRWGSGGGLLKSTDHGYTWEAIPLFANKNMWGVDIAPDNPKMVLAGMYSGGTIYISMDGGVNWKPTTISGSNYAIYIVDTKTIYAAQSTGFYKLRDPFGAKPSYKSLTVKNYPNPFNPSTTIAYSVPADGTAQILLYNTLGQLVREIKTGEVMQGENSVDLNMDNFASGLYYYTVHYRGNNGERFSETQKLILQK